MKVLVVGDMRSGSNSKSVAEGHRAVGHEVREIDTSWIFSGSRHLIQRLLVSKYRLSTAASNRRLERDISAISGGWVPDVVLAIKTIYFKQELILGIPARYHVHLSFDDVSNPHNVSAAYLRSEPHWDLVLTTKRHNVSEISARGGCPAFVWAAYDPRYHRAIVPFAHRKYDAGFIGAARPDRADLPQKLAQMFSGRAIVAGPRWDRFYRRPVQGVEMRGAVMGDEYTKVANSIRMGLVLLNSENRDQHTNRSLEVPLAGQLVLAQDTQEHRELFTEGESALFFTDLDDALGKLDEMMSHQTRASQIASRGHDLIRSGRFTYADRALELEEMLG